MKYTLMHRKIAVAEIELDEETVSISKIETVFAPEHLPVGTTSKNNKPDRGTLNEWWRGRSIPASRQNFREAMENMHVSSSEKLLIKCFGLSLSDQYWINPNNNQLNWDKINFFHNSFSEDVGNALFGKIAQPGNLNLMSPNNTSDGWLKKKWNIIDGKRCLVKGGDAPFYQEPFNETMATAVMNRLNITHVPYSIIMEDEKPYSVCKNFINSETELISAYYINNTLKKENNISDYQHFLNCCEKLNIPGVQEKLNKMLTVDYLIVNRDRHYSNFGAVRNAVTLEWLGLAPVFDSGASFGNNQAVVNLNKAKTESKPFRITHEEQIKLIKDFSWLDLSLLKGIEDEFIEILSDSDTIDEKRRNDICRTFNGRVENLSAYIRSIEPGAAYDNR